MQRLKSGKEFIPNPRHKAVLHLRNEGELLVRVNTDEQCVGPA